MRTIRAAIIVSVSIALTACARADGQPRVSPDQDHFDVTCDLAEQAMRAEQPSDAMWDIFGEYTRSHENYARFFQPLAMAPLASRYHYLVEMAEDAGAEFSCPALASLYSTPESMSLVICNALSNRSDMDRFWERIIEKAEENLWDHEGQLVAPMLREMSEDERVSFATSLHPDCADELTSITSTASAPPANAEH